MMVRTPSPFNMLNKRGWDLIKGEWASGGGDYKSETDSKVTATGASLVEVPASAAATCELRIEAYF